MKIKQKPILSKTSAEVAELLARARRTPEEMLQQRDFKAYLSPYRGFDLEWEFFSLVGEGGGGHWNILKLSDAEYWELGAFAWTGVQSTNSSTSSWLEYFQSKRPNRELLMTPTERQELVAYNKAA